MYKTKLACEKKTIENHVFYTPHPLVNLNNLGLHRAFQETKIIRPRPTS